MKSVLTQSDVSVYLVPTVPRLEFKGPLEETIKVLYLFMERNRYGVYSVQPLHSAKLIEVLF